MRKIDLTKIKEFLFLMNQTTCMHPFTKIKIHPYIYTYKKIYTICHYTDEKLYGVYRIIKDILFIIFL